LKVAEKPGGAAFKLAAEINQQGNKRNNDGPYCQQLLKKNLVRNEPASPGSRPSPDVAGEGYYSLGLE
jgi:hypothetical protein